jgi:nucleoside-diphosphate-sugar epimerase
MRSKALVTGGTGFIGLHLVEALLRRGEAVRCLVRNPHRRTPLDDLDVEQVPGDVTDIASLRSALQGVEIVYHVAGLVASLKPEDLVRVNGGGTGLVAEACAASGDPPLLVVVSSLAAAGPVPRGEVRSELDPIRPISLYGQSKREGELAAAAWAAKVPMTFVRPGVVFGPRNVELRPMLSTIYRFRAHPVPGWRCPPLSYIHVEDLVEILISAGERGRRVQSLEDASPGETSPEGFYFAEVGEYPDWGRFGRMFARSIGRPFAPVIHVPGPVPWAVGAASEFLGRVRGRAALLNVDKIREAVATSWACSSEWTRRDLGFEPPRSLEERVRETAHWFREAGWL